MPLSWYKNSIGPINVNENTMETRIMFRVFMETGDGLHGLTGTLKEP